MVSLPFLYRLLPNVNVVRSRFLFPLGLPYPNGSCNKIGFESELQINAIGIGWFMLPLPPKNRTCEVHRIPLRWLWFEDARPATPYQRIGKRFAVAKLTPSLSTRAKLRPRLLVTSWRLFSSPEI